MRVEVIKGAQVSLEEIAQELRLGDNFVITFHINPDYDAVGSSLSMFYILKRMEKNVMIVGDEEENIIRKILVFCHFLKKSNMFQFWIDFQLRSIL